MHTIIVMLGGLLAMAGLFFVCHYIVFIRRSRQYEREVMEKLAPLTQAIVAGKDPDPELIQRLAAAPITRNHTYGMLVYLKRENLFPPAYQTPEAIAESDLVEWLGHPHELGCPPDQIELVSRQYVETGTKPPRVVYFLFRFSMREPHWAAKNGWIAGVAGPYRERNGKITSGAPGTFSRFERFDSREPKDHVELVHQLMLKRNVYAQLRGA